MVLVAAVLVVAVLCGVEVVFDVEIAADVGVPFLFVLLDLDATPVESALAVLVAGDDLASLAGIVACDLVEIWLFLFDE